MHTSNRCPQTPPDGYIPAGRVLADRVLSDAHRLDHVAAQTQLPPRDLDVADAAHEALASETENVSEVQSNAEAALSSGGFKRSASL